MKIQKPGNWELIFLSGAFLAVKRVVWSFIGGFLLITGARMAGGCTSGHILSGGMQLAASSLLFAVFVFAGLLITGKVFYKKR